MELNKNKLEYWENTLTRCSSYEESTDSIVPDTFPDVKRITCAVGTMQIKDITPQKDRLLISGTVRTNILYEPENEDGLRILEVPLNFAHIEEGRGLSEDMTCFTRGSLTGVEAVTVNSRKISVTARMTFELMGYQPKQAEITESVTECEHPIELKKQTKDVTVIEHILKQDFAVLDDVPLTDAQGMTILRSECTFNLSECRAMNEKAVFRGDAVVKCLARQEDGELRTIEHPASFMQVVECPDLMEGSPAAIRFAANSVDCRMEEGGILSIGIGATALLSVEQTKQVSWIEDLYSTTHHLAAMTRPVHIREKKSLRPYLAEVTRDIPTVEPVSHVVAISAAVAGGQAGGTEKQSLPVSIQIIYQNEDGALRSVLKPISVEIESVWHDGDAKPEDMRVQVVSCAGGREGVSVRMRMESTLASEASKSFTDLTDLTIGEAYERENSGVTMVLRYVEDSENLWHLAKERRTTVASICTANNLPADTESVQQRMLLIPIKEV